MSLGGDILRSLTDEERAEFVSSLDLPRPAGGGWVRSARGIADYIGGCSPRRINELARRGLIPVHRDGGTLCARRDDLDDWIELGGARRRPPKPSTTKTTKEVEIDGNPNRD